MGRNLLIFADGTSMVGGLRPDQIVSNVYKLYRACRPGTDSCVSRKDQLAFYDAGIGANVDGGGFWGNPIKSFNRLVSMALGMGITENVADCYESIIRHYQPGDRIFLIGFSRGAYTVRNVAGVLNLCGVPEYCGCDSQPFPRTGKSVRKIAEEAVNIYEHGASKDRQQYEPERELRAQRFRQQYGSWLGRGDPQQEDTGKSNVAPYFIGVFDTVAALGSSGAKRALVLTLAAVGMVMASGLLGGLLAGLFGLSWLTASAVMLPLVMAGFGLRLLSTRLRVIHHYPAQDKPDIDWETGHWLPHLNFRWHLVSWQFRFFDRYLDNRVPFARHAIAIDEHRADFERVPWGLKRDQRRAGPDMQPEWFRQIWFAGSHGDIGGCFPEAESGLPDVALQWMVEQLEELPHPALIDKSKLQLDPDSLAIQHCAVHELLDNYPAWWPESRRFSWAHSIREVPKTAVLHPSVVERLRADTVLHHDGHFRPYRPAGLREHDFAKQFYDSV